MAIANHPSYMWLNLHFTTLCLAMKAWLLLIVAASAFPNLPCDLCKDTVGLLQKAVTANKLMIDLVEDVIIEVCGRSMNKTVCAGAIREMGTIVIDSLAGHYLSPELVCFKVGWCETPKFVKENLTAWLENVMADKPDLPSPQSTGDQVYRFAHISDLHFDYEYLVGAPTACSLPLCCRAGYPGNGTAGYWGDYNCDIPYRTLDAGISQLSQHPVDFILMTGDFAPHDIWNQSHAAQLRYIGGATEAIWQHFNSSQVALYPTLGNHECFPVNVFNMGDEQWVTKYISDLWGCRMDSEAVASLFATGSYSVLHPGTNLRVISLNTNACNNQNWWLFQNVTDPGGLILWLQGELQKAESNGELVYIIGHIAPGMGTCLDEWAYHYAGLVDRYEHTIRGQFFGHSHSDQFQLSRGVVSGESIGVQWVAPSLTTYTDINPSYRVVEADADTKEVLTYYQYRLDLPTANLHPTLTPEWVFAYEFLSEYSLPNANATTMDQFVTAMADSEALMLRYINNRQTGVLPASTSCGPACRYNEACGLRYGVQAEVMKCQNATWGLEDKVTRFLMGSWTYLQ